MLQLQLESCPCNDWKKMETNSFQSVWKIWLFHRTLSWRWHCQEKWFKFQRAPCSHLIVSLPSFHCTRCLSIWRIYIALPSGNVAHKHKCTKSVQDLQCEGKKVPAYRMKLKDALRRCKISQLFAMNFEPCHFVPASVVFLGLDLWGLGMVHHDVTSSKPEWGPRCNLVAK